MSPSTVIDESNYMSNVPQLLLRSPPITNYIILPSQTLSLMQLSTTTNESTYNKLYILIITNPLIDAMVVYLGQLHFDTKSE